MLVALALVAGAASAADDEVARGAYLLRAAGCVTCHTDKAGGGAMLAGGRALKTPFGVFYTPNITPDREHGIGAWSEQQFADALRYGVGPDGRQYYPVFPFPTYTRIRDDDVRALYAYLRTVKPDPRANREHQVRWPFGWRFLNRIWKWLFFTPGAQRTNPAHDARWNRGAYLVEALAHCGECHTPRNRFGALERDRWLAGNPDGPDGDPVPNITPDSKTGIGDWSRGDVVEYLSNGMLPDGDFAGGAMVDVIDDDLSHLERSDLEAIAEYLATVPPLESAVRRKRSSSSSSSSSDY